MEIWGKPLPESMYLGGQIITAAYVGKGGNGDDKGCGATEPRLHPDTGCRKSSRCLECTFPLATCPNEVSLDYFAYPCKALLRRDWQGSIKRLLEYLSKGEWK